MEGVEGKHGRWWVHPECVDQELASLKLPEIEYGTEVLKKKVIGLSLRAMRIQLTAAGYGEEEATVDCVKSGRSGRPRKFSTRSHSRHS